MGEPMETLEALAHAGADYVEWGVGSLMGAEAEFEDLRAAISGAPLKIEALNGFIPAHHRLTGPDVNLAAVLDYAGEALRRANALGVEIVVLGSGGARRVPDGFSMTQARRQFVEFAREIGPIAQENGVTIAIEPLNTSEDNLITGVTEGAAFSEEIAHPAIQLLADFYHMNEEGESTSSIIEAGAKLRHTHLADLGRVAPGFAPDGEADFHAFFGALKTIGYDARCSFEGKTTDLAAQARPLLDHMKQRFAEAQVQELAYPSK